MAQFPAGRRMVVRGSICLMFLTLISGKTYATSLLIRSVDNSAVPELSAYVTQDLVFSTETDWLSAQLALTLDTGTIYQDPRGGISSPGANSLLTHPSVQFDTYLSVGVLGEGVSVAGGAVDLGYEREAQFNSKMLSAVWYTTGTDDVGSLELGRISLSGDASGNWAVRISSSPAEVGPMLSAEGAIADGVMTAEAVTVTEARRGHSDNENSGSPVTSAPNRSMMERVQAVYDHYDQELLEARLRRSAESASVNGIRDLHHPGYFAESLLSPVKWGEILPGSSRGVVCLAEDVPAPVFRPYPYANRTTRVSIVLSSHQECSSAFCSYRYPVAQVVSSVDAYDTVRL